MHLAKRPAVLAGFLEDLNRLYEEMLDHFDFRPFRETGLMGRMAFPEIDVAENDNGFTVSCELPGLARKDLVVAIASNVLTIKGGRQEEKTIKDNGVFRKSSWYNAFYRSLPLPAGIDVLRSWAELKNGVLILVLPRKKTTEARQISLQRA
jgi:HSP20 family protein